MVTGPLAYPSLHTKTSFDVVKPYLESAPVDLDGVAGAWIACV